MAGLIGKAVVAGTGAYSSPVAETSATQLMDGVQGLLKELHNEVSVLEERLAYTLTPPPAPPQTGDTGTVGASALECDLSRVYNEIANIRMRLVELRLRVRL